MPSAAPPPPELASAGAQVPTLTETRGHSRGRTEGRTALPGHSAGMGRSGRSGDGAKAATGKELLFLPLGPRREASHLSLLQPTEQDSTCPRRDQYRLWLAWDPQPIAAAFAASGWAFVTCDHCQQPCPSPSH